MHTTHGFRAPTGLPDRRAVAGADGVQVLGSGVDDNVIAPWVPHPGGMFVSHVVHWGVNLLREREGISNDLGSVLTSVGLQMCKYVCPSVE